MFNRRLIEKIYWIGTPQRRMIGAMNPREAIQKLTEQGWSPQRIAAAIDVDTRKINQIRLGLDGDRWGLGLKLIELASREAMGGERK